jgi:hypothetical protein
MVVDETNRDDFIPDIREQLGRILPGLCLELKETPKKTELGESFDVWEIDTSKLRQSLHSGTFPALPTHYQHHQILFDGRARASALSEKLPSGSQKVFKVGVSDVAMRIDQAIDRIDSDVGDESSVVLLKARACWVYAFWLLERHQVFLVSVPSRFTLLSEQLQAGKYLEEMDFIGALHDEIGRVVGTRSEDLATSRL